ncbi:MAG TPA: phosphoribosylamine--glycine ligase [Actinomycetota bacterium]|nr:phosphoribosylamine--glycine ligase [Actinomycetota bacterium]
MNILLLGSGGRESALGWGIARSGARLTSLPGNPGLEEIGEVIPGDPSSPDEVVRVARRRGADLVVVGPEAPLVAGVGDALRASGFKVFGPDAAAARIEGSKQHAKELMNRAGIPTARARTCDDVAPALDFLDELGPPYVIKADGLAAGKGVVVTSDRREAKEAVRDRIERGVFGDAGRTVLIEEFLDGPETSLIAFCDGSHAVACEPAQDYKRVYDGDRGPNTGGMGSYSPVPDCPSDMAERIVDEVIEPMLAETARGGAPFTGALYAGLALTSRGPRVIEFNARFGDPETQALIPRLASDLSEVCLAAASGELAGVGLDWRDEACVAVVLASGGYPGDHEVGYPVTGLGEAAAREDVLVFHAGTALHDGEIVTSGGRVLAVTALGATFEQARERAYAAADVIEFENKQLRRDIAERAVSGGIPTPVSG